MNGDTMEELDAFRERARSFVRANLRPADPTVSFGILRAGGSDAEELAAVEREREVQRMLFDAGLAGICYPPEYGGRGLTWAHQNVLNEEMGGYEFPVHLQAPSISQCGAVILDFGTEAQKREHLPAILRGDEIWMQFLSEPSGGSDVAGTLTTAVRDGGRMGSQRLQDLDDRRMVVRLGAVPGPYQLGRAEASRLDRLHGPDPEPGDRGPPDRDAQRIPGVLPGVPDRRPRPRQPTGSARSTRDGRSVCAGCSTSACCRTRRTSPVRPAPPAWAVKALESRSSRSPAGPGGWTIRSPVP